MTVDRIQPPDPSAKFLAQFTRGGRGRSGADGGEYSAERLRALGLEIPTDDELATLWDEQREARFAPRVEPKRNRREKRAQASVDRRVEPLEPLSPKESAKARIHRTKLERRASTWEQRPDPTPEIPFWRKVEREVWIACKDIVSCTSGAAVKYWFGSLRNKTAIGAMRRAALCPLPNGGTLRSWSDERARRIAACAYALAKLGKHPTNRKGPWGAIVKGIPQTCLLLLLAYPDGTKVPSRSALIGHHRGPDSRSERGQLGYLPALIAAGFCHAQQWYPGAQPWELSQTRWFIGKDGRKVIPQINRYWIVSDPPKRGPKRADLIELNREGWLALSEHARGSRSYAAVHEDSAEKPVYSSVHGPD